MEDMELDSEAPISSMQQQEKHSKFLSKPKPDYKFSQERNHIPIDSSNLSQESADWSISFRNTRQFTKQYAHTYFIRLLSMRPYLQEKVEEQWEGIPLKPIAELCETSKSVPSPKKSQTKYISLDETMNQSQNSHEHEQHIALRGDIIVAIIGTLFKQQPDKPSILQELVDEIEIRSESDTVTSNKRTNFVSDKDVLLIEDETTRVRLIPTEQTEDKFSIPSLVNGVVCAIKGKPNIDGKFEVLDIIWATPSSCVWPKVKSCSSSKMVFISGLHLGQMDKNATQLAMLFEYLEGLCGSELEQTEVIGNISRIFFVGNSFADSLDNTSAAASIGHSSSSNEKFIKIAEISKKLDTLISQLVKTAEVYIVSGKTDPVQAMYPQPPLHSCLFPESSRYSNFHLVSNPTKLQLNISSNKNSQQLLNIILTDGEPITDCMRFSNITSPLEMSQKILQWGYLCPTAPDTLPLHPGVDKDVFVLKDLPNLFIVGNQPKFNTTTWNQTRILTLPSFSQNSTIGVLTVEDDFNFVPLEFNVVL